MRSHRTGILGWVVGLGVFAAVWLLFAPTQMGGSTAYATTEGISMLPKLHTGYLAVVRAGPPYRVGDAVLYNSPVLHRPVLHRIIALHDGQYSLQGDNNDFVDPGTVPASAITGRLWFHVPRVGGWVGWLSTPLHASLIAVVAAMFLLLGGTAEKQRRRRRGRRSTTPIQDVPPVLEQPEPPLAVPVVVAPDFGLRGLVSGRSAPDPVAARAATPRAAKPARPARTNLQPVAPATSC